MDFSSIFSGDSSRNSFNDFFRHLSLDSFSFSRKSPFVPRSLLRLSSGMTAKISQGISLQITLGIPQWILPGYSLRNFSYDDFSNDSFDYWCKDSLSWNLPLDSSRNYAVDFSRNEKKNIPLEFSWISPQSFQVFLKDVFLVSFFGLLLGVLN